MGRSPDVEIQELISPVRILAFEEVTDTAGPGKYRGVDWTAQYGDLFQTIGMEKTMMFLLLLLIVAIAAFNIVSGLVMLVDDKKGISPSSERSVRALPPSWASISCKAR